METGPRRRTDLALVELDGEAVIYDERTGNLHHLNSTATLVFHLLDGRTSIEDVAREIAEVVAVPAVEIRRQIDDVVSTFGQAGLLELASDNG